MNLHSTTQQVISIEKRHHRGAWQIFLLYDYTASKDIDRAVRQLPNRHYSGSQKCWYVPYSKAAYASLKALPFEIEVLAKGDKSRTDKPKITEHKATPNLPQTPVLQQDTPSTSTSDNADAITSNGDNNGISSPRDEQAVDSSIDRRETADINPDVESVSNVHADVTVSLNAKWLTLKLPFERKKVALIKNLQGAWWNPKHLVWMMKPLPENVKALQEICMPFYTSESDELGKANYRRMYERACQVSDPIVMELYQTPEFPHKVAVKVRGYGVSLDFLRNLPERNYEKERKRWLIPRSEELIDRLIAHYGSLPGVKIKNRLSRGKAPKAKPIDFAKQQAYLIGKYPQAMREVLTSYTDTLIRMRYSWKTVLQYTSHFGKYVKYLGAVRPKEANAKDANSYLSSLAKQQVSESMVHLAVNAIKFYYEKVIFLPGFELSQIKRPKKSHRLPTILSVTEVDRMLRSSSNLKHTAILYLLYSSGLRLSEMLSLKLQDVLWDRNQLFVRAGKGKKDRTVMLSETLKALLTLYFDEYQPKVYLFNGQDGESEYSSSSVQKIVRLAAYTAGIQRKVTPHTLRHCFATHLMESGTDVRYIQELLGHKDIKTTLIYTHVTNKSMKNITSPLDALSLNDKNRNESTGKVGK
ncbi:MAG: tyrosine-type recombinase/integrase [Saprospiraceae bacterium]